LEAFNRKYLGIRKRDGRIKKRELTILEKRLLKLGWKDLRWGPHEGKEIGGHYMAVLQIMMESLKIIPRRLFIH
jgi:hypothetical protein